VTSVSSTLPVFDEPATAIRPAPSMAIRVGFSSVPPKPKISTPSPPPKLGSNAPSGNSPISAMSLSVVAPGTTSTTAAIRNRPSGRITMSRAELLSVPSIGRTSLPARPNGNVVPLLRWPTTAIRAPAAEPVCPTA
jgi:hypothetical protein